MESTDRCSDSGYDPTGPDVSAPRDTVISNVKRANPPGAAPAKAQCPVEQPASRSGGARRGRLRRVAHCDQGGGIEIAAKIAAHFLPAKTHRVAHDLLIESLQLIDDRRPVDERRRAFRKRSVVGYARPMAQLKPTSYPLHMRGKFIARFSRDTVRRKRRFQDFLHEPARVLGACASVAYQPPGIDREVRHAGEPDVPLCNIERRDERLIVEKLGMTRTGARLDITVERRLCDVRCTRAKEIRQALGVGYACAAPASKAKLGEDRFPELPREQTNALHRNHSARGLFSVRKNGIFAAGLKGHHSHCDSRAGTEPVSARAYDFIRQCRE